VAPSFDKILPPTSPEVIDAPNRMPRG